MLAITTDGITGFPVGYQVALGNSTSGFDLLPAVLAPNQIRSLALADMNNDDELDIVISEFGLGTLRVIFGDGAGTFTGEVESDIPNASEIHRDLRR